MISFIESSGAACFYAVFSEHTSRVTVCGALDCRSRQAASPLRTTDSTPRTNPTDAHTLWRDNFRKKAGRALKVIVREWAELSDPKKSLPRTWTATRIRHRIEVTTIRIVCDKLHVIPGKYFWTFLYARFTKNV